MKKFLIQIHNQIIIALVLGAIFGIIFKENYNILYITKKDNNKIKIDLKEIKELELISLSDTIKLNTKNIKKNINLIKLNYNNYSVKYILNNETKVLENINIIEYSKSIVQYIKPLGDIFLRLLNFLAIPLVISTLVVGAGSLGDVKKLGKIGFKTLIIFIITTVIAISIGLSLANFIEPGKKLDKTTKLELQEYNQNINIDNILKSENKINLIDFLVNIVPKNPFEAIAKGEMLQIVFVAVIFGFTLNFISNDKSKILIDFFGALSELMLNLVNKIMYLAPFGVFALIASTVSNFGFEILGTLTWYILTVIIGLLLQIILVYGLLIKFFTNFDFLEFLKSMREAQLIAFSTSSSAATLPITIKCVEQNLKISNKYAGFVLPLGATINMDGTALYQGVATVFIAQIFGIDLSLTQQLTIVMTAVLASIGTAPVPGVGIIMLVMILNSVNLPIEGIALIIGVDRILDMCRTISNITGDATVCAVVANEKS